MAAAINRSVSPMLVHRENFEETRNVVLEKIEKLKKEQKSRSPFLVGSIGEVSKRISHLDHKLQNYTQLVAESRASEIPDLKPPSTAARKERVEKREKDEKELTKFAGVYSLKSTFGVSTSERVKNVSKISMNPNKTVAKKDTGKPKFVELYQYGGYDPNQPTPLPDGLSVLRVLQKVTRAQPHLERKSSYRVAFEKLFNSTTSQCILLDSFWWCFLNQFQSDKESQCQLFRRIALNYVKLLLSCTDMLVREAFLRDYPDLLSQSVYASFCESFPDSYRQFDDNFKEMIVSTLSEWIVGTKPSPGAYRRWNCDALEPANIKQREELMKKKDGSKNKLRSSGFNLENLGSLHSPSSHSSHTTLNNSTSHESVTSNTSSNRQSVQVSEAINKVAQAQGRQRRIGVVATPHDAVPNAKSLPTIREAYSRENETLTCFLSDDEEEAQPPTTIVSTTKTQRRPDLSVYWNKSYRKQRESHPAGRGPDFSRNAFNLYGQSPLVAQFLEEKKLTSQSGCDVIVQRTEIDKLPSSDDETYLDLVKKGYQQVRQRSKETKALFRDGKRASGQFSKHQQSELRELQTKEAALLTNHREVKRLCNLIILEQRKDDDSIPAGVEAAVEQALDQAMDPASHPTHA